MADFIIHNAETAPEASKPFIDRAQQQFGMVPNLIGLLAESPAAVESYQTLSGIFQASSLTPTERNVVWLTINYENECHYCMAAHTAIAKSEKVDGDVIEAIRNGIAIEDPKLESLRSFTRSLVANRGWVDGAEVDVFLAAGFTKENVFDVLVGISQKVLSNYSNHIATTPVDAPFRKFTWEKSPVITS
jgi:AhpD family alkylhydroperoxidase